MALRGNLTDFTLSDVFQLVAMSRKTGVLRINRLDASRGSVWFRDGEVFFAESNYRRERLGDRLVATQRLAPSALAKAVEMRAADCEGRRLGTILVDEGYISRGVLEAFVQEQILDTIFDLMRWEDGEFDFEITAESPEEDIGVSVSIENIAMESGRRLEEWERIKKKVPSMDIVFKMASAPGEGPFEISLKPIEWNVLLLIDGTRSVAEVAEASGMTDFDVARVVYGLFSGGLLEVVGDEELAELRQAKAARQAAEPYSPPVTPPDPYATPGAALPGYTRGWDRFGSSSAPPAPGDVPFGAGAGIADLESGYERMREPYDAGPSTQSGLVPEEQLPAEAPQEMPAPFVESEAPAESAPRVEPDGGALSYEAQIDGPQAEVISYVEEGQGSADEARMPLEAAVFSESVEPAAEPVPAEYVSPPLAGGETTWPAPAVAPEEQSGYDLEPSAPCGEVYEELPQTEASELPSEGVPAAEPNPLEATTPPATVDVRMDLSVSSAISDEITELTGVRRSAYLFTERQTTFPSAPEGWVRPTPSEQAAEASEPAVQAESDEAAGPPVGWPTRRRGTHLDKDTLLGIIEGVKRL